MKKKENVHAVFSVIVKRIKGYILHVKKASIHVCSNSLPSARRYVLHVKALQ